MSMVKRWLVAGSLGTGIAAVAYRRHSLSFTGACGAALVGTAVYSGSGFSGAALLLTFFGSSTALSHLPEPGQDEENSPARTLTQVLANGGLPALLSLGARESSLLNAALAGSLAAANADTWATEIGSRSGAMPRMITTGRQAEPGVSGAVTWPGLLASVAGATLIGAVHGLLNQDAALIKRSAVAGVAGSLADSLLGATLQSVYHCESCGARTEDAAHRHPGETSRLTLVRGWPGMTNDAVNICASVTGALVGALIYGRGG